MAGAIDMIQDRKDGDITKTWKAKAKEDLANHRINTIDPAGTFNMASQITRYSNKDKFDEFVRDAKKLADINGYNIIDLDGYYIELLSVLECCAYSVDEIIELIVNFKYLYSHYLVRDDAIYGYMETYVVLEFMYILKGKAANRECREEFHFSKNADSIKDKNDFYDEFMRDLAKSIKKHTGGKRNGK